MEHLFSLFTYPFMQNAITASILAAIACGIVGTLVVCNRLTFLAGGASHAAYGGIGLALHYQLPLLPCTIAFSLLASLLMGGVSLRQEQQNGFREAAPDAAIGVLWAAGMAFGIILIQLTPGYVGELMGFLFGSILAVPPSDLIAMAAFDLVLLGVLVLFRQGLWAASIDREFSRARGLPVGPLFLLTVGLTAVAVVLLIRVAGLILVLALLTIPPFLARRMCASLYSSMAAASGLALIFCLCGLAISWQTNISPGPSIVAVATICYFAASLPMRRFLTRLRPQHLMAASLSARALVVIPALLIALTLFLTPASADAAQDPQIPTKKAARSSSQKNSSQNSSKRVGNGSKKEQGDTKKGKSSGKYSRGKKIKYSQKVAPGQSDTVSASEQMEARTAAALASPSAFSPSPQISVEFSTSSLKRNVSSCVALPEYDDDCSLAEKGITSGFGVRRGHFHKGVDLPAPDGSPIQALTGGVVQFSGRDKAYGNCVLLEQDNGLVARYAHMQSTPLHAGDKVKAGQYVGAIGRTGRAYGSHLHFELMDGGKLINPAPYIRSGYEMVPDCGKRGSTSFANRSKSGRYDDLGDDDTRASSKATTKGKSRASARDKKQPQAEAAPSPRKRGKSSLTLARYPDSGAASSTAPTLP